MSNAEAIEFADVSGIAHELSVVACVDGFWSGTGSPMVTIRADGRLLGNIPATEASRIAGPLCRALNGAARAAVMMKEMERKE